MKYCTYCGAVLQGSAVFFCSECGKPVNEPAEDDRPRQKAPVKTTIPTQSVKGPPEPGGSNKTPRSGSHTQMKMLPKDKRKQKPPVRPNMNMKRRSPPERASAIRSPMDINYDGYYDDVPTADNGQTKDRLEPELIKKVAFIAAGTAAIVVLSIIIMYVL